MSNDIDKRILEALNSEDRELVDSYKSELGLVAQVTESFKSKNKFLYGITFIFGLAFYILGVYSIVQFFLTDVIDEKLAWLGGAILGIFVNSIVKIWYWMELNRRSLSREIKRLELQVSLLNNKLS